MGENASGEPDSGGGADNQTPLACTPWAWLARKQRTKRTPIIRLLGVLFLDSVDPSSTDAMRDLPYKCMRHRHLHDPHWRQRLRCSSCSYPVIGPRYNSVFFEDLNVKWLLNI
jgi:hypothetical protein